MFSFAQDEVELFGEWFLNYRTVGGSATYPPLTTEEDYNVILNFRLLPPNAGNPFIIESYGPTTTNYEGRFEVENGIMYIFNVEENVENCEHPELVCSYFEDYNNEILFDPDAIVEPGEYALTYEVTGTGDDAVLTITNDFNNPEGVIGAHAVYGRQPATYNAITGNWFVQSITTDGVQHDNYIGEIAINFTETPSFLDGSFTFNGGSPCNGYGGTYTLLSDNTLAFIEWGALDSCSSSDAFGRYYFKYADILEVSINSNEPISLDYEIIGTGSEQIMTITNSEGDFVIFGKEAPTETIFKTWYSYSTETANGIIYPSPLDSPTLEISPWDDGTLGLGAFGNGGCNEFFANHNIYSSNENEFWIYLFDQTFVECQDDTYEPTYFSVLSTEVNAIFSYELQDEGQTLILTNTIGEVLIFGEQPPPTTNFLGEWMLHYLLIEGNQLYNPFNTLSNIWFEATPSFNEGFIVSGSGPCNGFFADYYFNPGQEFTIKNFSYTLSLCDTAEEELFENYYFFQVLSNDPNPDSETELHYNISGTGDDALLVITNLMNGYQAFYGRQALSVSDFEYQSASITLDKNPVHDILTLSIDQIQNANYEIYSITGKLVSNGRLYSNLIDVEELQSGLYFLKVYTNVSSSETLKFIKN